MAFANGRPVSSLEDKRRERAGFDKLAVPETPDADLIAERDRVDAAWEVWAGKDGNCEKDFSSNIDRLAVALETVQTELATIAIALKPDSLGGAVIGLMGNSAEEVRHQLSPLREALKDERGDAA